MLMDIYLRQIGQISMMSHPQEKEIFTQIEKCSHKLESLVEKLRFFLGELNIDCLESVQKRIAEVPETDRPTVSEHLERALHYKELIHQLRHRIVKANLRLAVCVAKKYQNQGLSLLDLVQEANTGLMNAVEKFDYHRGVKFGAYASWWIQQAIVHALANQGRTIRIPAYMVETLRRVNRIRETLVQTNEREPNAEELVELADITPALSGKLPYLATHVFSLDMSVEGNPRHTLAQTLVDQNTPSPEDQVIGHNMTREIAQALEILPEREAQILRLRYGFEDGISYSLQEIGEILNLSRERIRQLEKKALDTLRHPMRSARLREYLELCS